MSRHAHLTPLSLPEPDRFESWLTERCDASLAEAAQLVDAVKRGAVESRLEAWNELAIVLSNVFALAGLMANVHPDEAVRDRSEKVEQDAQRLVTEIWLDRELYDALNQIDPSGLDDLARRLLELSLRDFRRSGVDRSDEERDRLRLLSERLTEVGQEFSRNIRDSVGEVVCAPHELDGLPEDFVAAHPPADDGKVHLTTEYPDYVPFMTFAHDRDARARMVHAFLNRAWPENDAVLTELLRLRREQATLLGYPDWASYDAEVKMIGSGPAIADFIEKISELAEPAAHRDYDILLARVREDHPEVEQLNGVYRSYYGEVIRKERFDVDAQQVRAYFDFPKVVAGLLSVTGRLFGLTYVPAPEATVWHEEVACYDVLLDGNPLGRIYLDLHPRPGKYSHAAQFTLVEGVAGRQLPEGTLVCNFPRGLMEHDDVVTLFHEFGHLVHHLLGGNQSWVRFSGVATEWDFVEAPSQLLEEWAWDPHVLASFATNQAGEPIPEALVARMRTGEEFGKGYLVRTQMFYAALSYHLHQDVPDDLTEAMRRLQEKYDLFGYVSDTQMHAGFGHLQGYSSGYYTYMWSQVIAKDLFSAFDHDRMLDTGISYRYRDRVLAPGGSKDAADLVADFLGRPYSFDAFQEWLES